MQDYITRIKFFNARVGPTGIPYWEVVKAGLGREIYTRYSLGARATSDMDLEQRLLEVGKSYEESLHEAKALGLKNPQLFGSREETGKGKEQRKGDKYTPSSAKAGPSGTNADKKDKGKKPERSAMKGARSKEGGDQKDQKYKQVHFDFNEAHEGVPKEMLEKRKKKNCAEDVVTATTYGKPASLRNRGLTASNYHQATDEKAAAAAAIKRKRQSDDAEPEPEAKKPKAAALAIQAINGPIWPVSDDEEQEINDAQMTDF
jgi:hypothetical protein